MIKKIGKYEVELRELTWYESKVVEAEMTSGARLNNNEVSGMDGEYFMKYTLKMIEYSIVKIKEGDKEYKYSEQWLKGLSKSEGDELFDGINEITKKK